MTLPPNEMPGGNNVYLVKEESNSVFKLFDGLRQSDIIKSRNNGHEIHFAIHLALSRLNIELITMRRSVYSN